MADTESYKNEREQRKLAWMQKHADPLFGLPDDDYGSLQPVHWHFSKVAFRHARILTVTVSTFGSPSQEHREMFLWLENNIPAIQDVVPNRLIAAVAEDLESDRYGEANPERSAIAFRSTNIVEIELRNCNPVAWSVVAFHATQQDVYVTVEGNNEVVTRAFLSM